MKKVLAVLLAGAIVAPVLAQGQWHSARKMTGQKHRLWLFDSAGAYQNKWVDQVAGAQTSSWGHRDGCFDGKYVYFGWENGVARYNQDGSGGTTIVVGRAPGNKTWRAMAHDPKLDGGKGGFWTADFGSALSSTTMLGKLIKSFPMDRWSLYGLSFDPKDGNLWGHSSGGAIIKISTATGKQIAGGFPRDPKFKGTAQGGLSGTQELAGKFSAVMQGTPDEYGIYDPAIKKLSAGPWSVQGPTKSNGHLGVAVIPEPATLLLLGLAALLRRR